MSNNFTFFESKAAKNDARNAQKGSPPDLLCLKGEAGTLACRVHDPLYAQYLPQHTGPWGRRKYAWLSEEKMNNLVAVRGRPGAGMVGPADYFGDLDRSDLYRYTIDIGANFIPRFTQHPLDEQGTSTPNPVQAVPNDAITRVNAQWFSGFDKETISAKMAEYPSSSVFGGNLFPNSGILEIAGVEDIKLKSFNPVGLDLSPFKARLVPNDKPFQITAEQLHIDDEYCAVTYHYDTDYAEEQVKTGGGAFLEFHQFAQTITPLAPDSCGFVTLAKWNDRHTQLEMIGVQILYGYTLIVEKRCIHGDTTLDGMFLMCMTSDHVTMATADTVFLKQAETKNNISMTLDRTPDKPLAPRPLRLMDPLVVYEENKEDDCAQFRSRTRGMSFIFTPTKGYWEVKKQDLGTLGLWLLSGTCMIAAIILLVPALVVLAGIGLMNMLSEITHAAGEHDPAVGVLAV
ncbi:hypothetical protein [Legionella worsleiensis]|uniref:Uncharacterized protein n=1 Tax=Legionella worsleiensis TaxID=45076 RepID=A0A0W1AKI3_9GAMM|nr:hypothetical protein [Legionella worsleiensis]KTD81683.1 hypothetical protein Lwor_0465 [Legionella worsleiensis]STY31907.1 Uncharacterised protein [Legionella worsleiensis]